MLKKILGLMILGFIVMQVNTGCSPGATEELALAGQSAEASQEDSFLSDGESATEAPTASATPQPSVKPSATPSPKATATAAPKPTATSSPATGRKGGSGGSTSASGGNNGSGNAGNQSGSSTPATGAPNTGGSDATDPNAGKTWHDAVYEDVWVVDVPASTKEEPVYEERDVIHCNCGDTFTDKNQAFAHADEHLLNGQNDAYKDAVACN
ncbi:hypothetical protein LJC56_03340 [Christensenellaceae bacterium OttesenSCG-928-K19]|nr:hypothetical protein [Christensenellaceae bacterium OttesenSCG-928-K19]